MEVVPLVEDPETTSGEINESCEETCSFEVDFP